MSFAKTEPALLREAIRQTQCAVSVQSVGSKWTASPLGSCRLTKRPARDSGHTVRLLRAAAADTGVLVEAAKSLPSFHRPALVVWASEDRVMPPEHGRRLAELLPDAQLVEVDDSYTLMPVDQPARLAQVIGTFARASARTAR